MFWHSLSVISVCGYKRSNLHEVTVEWTWGLPLVTTTPHTLWTILTRKCSYHKYLRTKGLGSLTATAIFTPKKMKFPIILHKTLAAGHASQSQVLLYIWLLHTKVSDIYKDVLKKWKKKKLEQENKPKQLDEQSSKANDKTSLFLCTFLALLFFCFFFIKVNPHQVTQLHILIYKAGMAALNWPSTRSL